MRCGPGVEQASRTPVLLVHGTFLDASSWDPTYARTLPRAGDPTCTVNVPDQELGDVQRSVEYVVHAIRAISARAGRPIAVVGHSQGAFLPSLALRLWPDLATKVADFVGLAGVYGNGTQVARLACALRCAAAARQLSPGSNLLAAYARRPLYDGPDYTTISTVFDELVVPQPTAGRLGDVRDIAVQDLCPGRPVEHGGLLADAVAYALVRDALDHDGPADARRVGTRACGDVLMPDVDGPAFAALLVSIVPTFPGLVTRPVGEEPALRCALDRVCEKPRLRPTVEARTTPRTDGRRPWTFTTTGRLEQPEGALDRCAGRVVVRIARGRRTVSRRSAPVAPDCGFASRVRLGRTARAGRRVRGSLRVTVQFQGAGELLGASARAQRVRAR